MAPPLEVEWEVMDEDISARMITNPMNSYGYDPVLQLQYVGPNQFRNWDQKKLIGMMMHEPSHLEADTVDDDKKGVLSNAWTLNELAKTDLGDWKTYENAIETCRKKPLTPDPFK
jgi:hypothetical protein